MRLLAAMLAALSLSPLVGCEVPGNSNLNGQVGPLDAALVAKASTVLASCLPGATASGWLARFYLRPRIRTHDPESQVTAKIGQAVTCLANRSNGCAAVGDCLSMGIDVLPAPAMPSPSSPTDACPARCDGNIAEWCEGLVRTRIDCGRYGLVCSPESNRCEAQADLGSCMPATFVPTCDGGRPFFCSPDNFLRLGATCTDLGLACVEGKAECQGNGPPCTGGMEDRVLGCQGALLSVCAGERATTLDCNATVSRSSCRSFGSGGTGSFCGTATECHPLTDAPTCEGTDLVVCSGGKIERISCTALGFTGCDPRLQRCAPGLHSRLP